MSFFVVLHHFFLLWKNLIELLVIPFRAFMESKRFLFLIDRLARVPPVGAPLDEIGVIFFFILFITFVDFLLDCKGNFKPILRQVDKTFVSTIKVLVLRNLGTICPRKNEKPRHRVRKYPDHHEQRQ
jgi:hypothetical protein